MKFLENVGPDQEVLPINYIYCNEHNYEKDDVLSIVYMDVATKTVHVQNIVKPEIIVYIVDPKYRTPKTNYNRTWAKKDGLIPYKVRYRNRYSQIAKILNLNDKDKAKTSPYVYLSNLDIRNYYALQFIQEYKIPESFSLNIGLFDIENDIIDIDHFPQPGECPISLIAFMDVTNKSVYQFILEPQVPAKTIDPDTGKPYDYRDQVAHLKEHVKEYIQDLHSRFDESYGELNYHILFLKDEIEMIRKFFKLLDILDINFAEAWNAAYDMSNLTTRPERLMESPAEVICSNKFKVGECEFVEDKNPLFHKRKHKCQISHPTVFVDQMVIYAGLRSAMGKIPSLRLNAIAKKEIGDSKLDYSEEGTIRELPYRDFWKYCVYSVKDVLLQYGIERSTGDIPSIYSRMLEDGLLCNDVFTSTVQLTNSLSTFLFNHGYIPGNNFNKFTDKEKISKQVSMEIDSAYEKHMIISDMNTDEAIENSLVDPDDMIENIDDFDDDDDTIDVSPSKKKKQFSGAMVQNPNRMLSTGFEINHSINSKVHDIVTDMDITSEYPTVMILSNMASEKLIGIFVITHDMYDYMVIKYGIDYLENHRIRDGNTFKFTADDVAEYRYNRLPMYNYDFIGDDANTYKLNISDDIVTLIAYDDVIHIGMNYMNLPSYEEVMEKGLIQVHLKGE